MSNSFRAEIRGYAGREEKVARGKAATARFASQLYVMPRAGQMSRNAINSATFFRFSTESYFSLLVFLL